MKMRMVSIVLVVLSSSAFAWAQDVGETALKPHQGKWQAEAITVDGKVLPADELTGLTRTVKGNVTTRTQGNATGRSRIHLDASKRPQQIDVEVFEGPELKAGETLKIIGIYEFNGDDKLILCTAASGGRDRPTEFKSTPGSAVSLQVWKRTKE